MRQERIKLALQLLNNIEVKGEQNLNNLLASIQTIQGLLQEAQSNDGMDSSLGNLGSGGPVFHGGQADTQS